MRCRNCNNEIGNATFCNYCGTPTQKKGGGAKVFIIIFAIVFLLLGIFGLGIAIAFVGNGFTSSNVHLKSLAVDNYNLEPSFDPNITKYTVTVPHKITSVNIYATPLDYTYKVEGVGNKNISIGDNKYRIRVTDSNNNTNVYTINVVRDGLVSKETCLNKIIELPKGNYDKTEARNIINRIGLYDIRLLNLMYESDATIILVDGPITSDYRFSHLKGVVPRGWEKTKYTWDDVPGAGGYPNTIIRIGYTFPSAKTKHSSDVLELHEVSHMLDHLLGTPSSTAEFKKIHKAEKDLMYPGQVYYNYPEEYFANALMMYTYSNSSRNKLKTKTPKTYKYIEDMISNL